MPGILDLVSQSLGGDAVQNISQEIGANPQQTQSAIAAALPMLLSGLARNAATPGGADALHGAIQRDHDGSVLDNLGALLGGGAANNSGGAGILGHVLGERRELAERTVAGTSGLDGRQVAALLTMLAPLVMGAIARTQRSQGLNSGGLASALQGEQREQAAAAPDLMGMATRLFDSNHDGSILDDVAKGLGGFLGKR